MRRRRRSIISHKEPRINQASRRLTRTLCLDHLLLECEHAIHAQVATLPRQWKAHGFLDYNGQKRERSMGWLVLSS